MKALTKKLLALGASSLIAVTGGYLIDPWEGKRNDAYKDIVGVYTICYGETKGVKIGDYRTDEQCDESLVNELTSYNSAMRKYVKVGLKPYEEIAYTSFVWNLGETNFKNSTLLRKLNAGDKVGACNALLSWNKVTVSGSEVSSYLKRGETCTPLDNGKYSCTVKGLTNRRTHEHTVCMGKDSAVNAAIKELEADEKPLQAPESVIPSLPPKQEEINDSAPPLLANDIPLVSEECRWKIFKICLKRK